MKRLQQLETQLSGSDPNGFSLAAHHFVFSDEVKQHLFYADRQTYNPAGAARVVALESTIISHGMPYPDNLACANELEDIVRKEGAVPATIAILDGIVHIGLNPAQLERLAKDGKNCAKCSRRDIPLLVAQKKVGATTVAATILLAQMAGITIMATGGVGGVHRGVEHTMDVSADLTELGRTRVLVVSAGIKSILDIPRTLEYLETQGVAVMGYQTKEFPAFFTRQSGCEAPLTVNTPQEAADMVDTMVRLRYVSGAILAVPIPRESEADGGRIQKAIDQALKELEEQKIHGREATPFLLKRINELTKGASLKSNLALVKNNTKVAAQIASLRGSLKE